ncbi:MAG: T9SS C-terminal target domain-containing protein [Ignavibacteriae bacterium]|nr:MAG: T9SS C-terminal target domain-containing protein [Ignavibacteriota bacterium]
MKYKFIILISVFLLFKTSVAQTNYSDFQSVVTSPPMFNIAPNGTVGRTDVFNGYDNFNMGVDFAEPYIATNPRDPANSFCAYNMNGLYYTKNGYTWIKNNPSFPGYGTLGDPVMCYDSLGVAYYVQLYQNGSVYGMVVVKSTNKCVDWSAPYAMTATTAGLTDKEWIIADQSAGPYSNYLYAGWRQFGSQSNMRFIRSTNGGMNWSTPITLSGSQGAYVSVGPNGNTPGGCVYFACMNGGSLVLYRSTDAGQTFPNTFVAASPSPPGTSCAGRNTVKNCIRTDMFPRMAVDNSYTSTRGNVYIAYAGNPPGPDLADVYIVRSTNYGLNWSDPIKVNDDATTTDQWMPSINVDNKTGRIYMCWYDSRIDPSGNVMTQVYGSISTNGGTSFISNSPISDVAFNPNTVAVGQPGGEKYMGDYIGISDKGVAAWMDGRNNNMGSYTAYYPDFALTLSITSANLVNNDSLQVKVRVPSRKGIIDQAVRFTVSVDTLPQSGSIQFSFLNGKDSITTIPDSVTLKIKTVGSVTPRRYIATVKGFTLNGTPIHARNIELLVNTSILSIGTNRNNIVDYKVNGITYNTHQNLAFQNASTVTVQALSPKIVGGTKYIYKNWSDNGDTTHSIVINANTSLTAFYKPQYLFLISSSVGNTFGGSMYYDSAVGFTFGVNSRIVNSGGQYYMFRGWAGTGLGSYTSPDSTGNDSAVTLSINNSVLETARWTALIGINNISNEIPKEYKLYQNYPNPFNPATTINFDIKDAGNVKIVIYDILGKEVKILVNENSIQPGKYKITFDGDEFASGLYFYRITANNFTDIKKMLLVK